MGKHTTLFVLLFVGGAAAPAAAQVRNINPAWSPAGSRIAFVSNRDGNPEIYVMDAAGGAVRNLSAHEGLDLSPAWSHDGRRIAFVSNRDGRNDIYLYDVDTEGLERLTFRGDILASNLAWSPADDWIAYGVGTHRDADLYMQRLDRSTTMQLTRTEGLDAAPAWSPDGRTIAFVSNRQGSLDIYGFDVGRGTVTPIAASPEEEGWPSWSPDGRELTFFTARDGNFEVYVAAADGSGARNLTSNPARDFGPAWSPMLPEIAFVSDRLGPGEDIYVLTLDGRSVRQVTFGRRGRPD